MKTANPVICTRKEPGLKTNHPEDVVSGHGQTGASPPTLIQKTSIKPGARAAWADAE